MSDSLARRRSRSPRTRTRCRKTSKPLARSSARTWPSARRRRRAADDSSFPLPFPRPCKAHEIRHLGASAPVSKTSMGGFGNRGFESLPLRPPARLSVAGWLVLVFGRFAHIHGGFRLPRRTTGPMRGTGAGGGVLAAAELTNGQLIDGSSSPNGARDHCPDGRGGEDPRRSPRSASDAAATRPKRRCCRAVSGRPHPLAEQRSRRYAPGQCPLCSEATLTDASSASPGESRSGRSGDRRFRSSSQSPLAGFEQAAEPPGLLLPQARPRAPRPLLIVPLGRLASPGPPGRPLCHGEAGASLAGARRARFPLLTA
jgi:hypothetical protein